MIRRSVVTGAVAAALAMVVVSAPMVQAAPASAPAVPAVAAPTAAQPLIPSPPGSNDWDCEPTAAHPNPVVLVHGLLANQSNNWFYMSPRLAEQGYCVFALTYGQNPLVPPPLNVNGGLTSMRDSAEELSAFIDEVLDATGAEKVDILGHSEGSLMPNHYVKFLGGAEKVDRYIGLTPLWDGTNTLALDSLNGLGGRLGLDPVLRLTLDRLCTACREFLRGSDFIAEMNSDGGPAVDGVTYTMILTKYDQLVVPYTSGLLDGATNIVLQEGCPTNLSEHATVAFDPVALQHVRNALDPANAEPVRCLPVGPRPPAGAGPVG